MFEDEEAWKHRGGQTNFWGPPAGTRNTLRNENLENRTNNVRELTEKKTCAPLGGPNDTGDKPRPTRSNIPKDFVHGSSLGHAAHVNPR